MQPETRRGRLFPSRPVRRAVSSTGLRTRLRQGYAAETRPALKTTVSQTIGNVVHLRTAFQKYRDYLPEPLVASQVEPRHSCRAAPPDESGGSTQLATSGSGR
jgi:hypothetical protein